MNPKEYQTLALRTEVGEGQRPTEVRLAHAARGIAGEAGEVNACIEKWLDYSRPLDLRHLAEELGDLLWYVALACNAGGLDMGKVMTANIAKLRVRYPGKFDGLSTANRDVQLEKDSVCDVFEANARMAEQLERVDDDKSSSFRQTCPYCNVVNLVAGLHSPTYWDLHSSNESHRVKTVYCYSCGTKFDAVFSTDLPSSPSAIISSNTKEGR